MTSQNRSLASLARQLERAIPKSFKYQFDAESFLDGTWVSPFGPSPRDTSESHAIEHHPECPEAPWNTGPTITESRPQPAIPRNPGGTTSDYLPPPQVINTPEPGITTSDNLRDPRKRCRATNRSGNPCNAYRLKNGDLCLFHEADAITNLDQARSRGGQQSPKRSAVTLETMQIDFRSPASLLAFTEGLIRMQLAGLLPHRQCSQILRTLRIAERTQLNAGSPDSESYLRGLQQFLETAPTVAESLETRELHDRAREIEDVGAKRQEYLKANQQFGHNQPRPTRLPIPLHMPKFFG